MFTIHIITVKPSEINGNDCKEKKKFEQTFLISQQKVGIPSCWCI